MAQSNEYPEVGKMPKLTYEDLKQAVSGTAAEFRTITRLQPLGGPGHPRGSSARSFDPGW